MIRSVLEIAYILRESDFRELVNLSRKEADIGIHADEGSFPHR